VAGRGGRLTGLALAVESTSGAGVAVSPTKRAANGCFWGWFSCGVLRHSCWFLRHLWLVMLIRPGKFSRIVGFLRGYGALW
jgi:hypothetical protein